MKENGCCFRISFDPRTKILLLILANLMIFLGASEHLNLIYMAAMAILLLLAGCYRSVFRFLIVLLVLVTMNTYIFPIAPRMITMLFSISVNYTYKMLPCLMAGVFLIRTTSLHDIVLVMRKCRLPQQLIIPIAVTIRYFPAIVEEIRHIRNAMRLRAVPIASRVECFVVPFMMAASTTVEELSAAAVTRGIENPAEKTSMVQLQFGICDYAAMLLGAGMLAAVCIN